MATVASFIGADGTNPTAEQRPPLHRAQAARRSARRARPRSSPGSGARCAGRGDPRSSCSRCRTSRSRRASRRTQYQYTLEDADPEELAIWAPRVLEQLARAARAARRGERPAVGRACSSTLTIDRDTAARLGHPAAGHRRRALRRLRAAAGLDHLHPAQPVPGHPGGEARVPAGPARPRPHLRAVGDRRAGAALGLHAHGDATTAPLAISHQGQFPAVTLSFNLAPGVVARPRGRRHRRAPDASIGLAAGRARRLHRHRRRRSGSRWRASPCSSWPRSSPSTSCSACSTRATSTR